ncbi:hypothetical protein KC19_7G086700 [Ceratodon purpureus]|uniref:DNA polymerase III gamma subunit domain-containing protein n=1 Tax=Ceratodon purpureus TaxID=3225 RepID=A0A8T0H4C4_CERPU|nr:hypothetical protein KC19_7G086700 [Ceratodon purpureus]
MTRRPGKAPQPCSPSGTEKSTPRTHQKRHLHLSNNIHVKNHIHMQRSQNRMLDPRRTPHHLPLRRELTAVKKVKSLQDPSTSSSFSPVSACSSVTRHETSRTSNAGAQLDELQAHERARRQARRRIAREEQAGMDHEVDRNHTHSRGDNLRSDGELRIGGGSRDSRGRIRRDPDENAALTQWSERNRDHQLFSRSQQPREPPPWSTGYRVEERWQGDAEEIARRLIAEQSGQMSSPAHSYMSNLARAHGLSLLGFRDDITTSEAEGSFLESEDGEAGHPGVSSSHLSNSAGSPLVRSHRNRRRPLPKDGNGNGYGNGHSSLRVGLHSRARAPPRRAVHGYKEAPVVPTMSDELDVSEIPQNGCGMPWYWTSGANKFKGKSLLDYAGVGLTCAFPEAVLKKKVGDSKQVSRASSRHGSQRDLQVPIDGENHAIPLLNEVQEPNDEVDEREAVSTYEQRDAPARETPVSARQSVEKSPKAASEQVSTSRMSKFTRSMSQKYRPKSFRDVVGQTLVVKSLTTAVTKGKVAPVYLFAGPRGTGKTTCARVFAAALVCLNTEPHRRPCGLCRECATLTLNRSRDVKEVDVASCSDLEHIKALLNLSPSNGRQQVFIIEGCDFLSVEVWTSFLKFLDEPPRNVVFILITTDGLERLPMAATSRCQKYHFGKLKESEIGTRLQVLAEKENLDVDEAALLLISSRADGSLRDAESMLDQLSLLDQTITLSMVQELSGLIPDEKLVNLLDMALAADTVNTVKGMRALLDAGIDSLSLVAQLASLITNILAGTFDLRRESRKKGFFSRNMSRREEQQRLRQALKVLAECEKQLRASSDRPTWLTAALLQFAPDRSYLPSSVDTSMAPSPIAFDTFERVPTGEPCTPRLPSHQPAGDSKSARKRSQNSPSDISSGFQRPGQGHRDKEKSASPAEQAARVHPSATEPALDHADDRGHRPTSSLVLFDPSRAVGNRDFRVLPRRDMEDIWDKVLDGCRSNVLRQLLSTQGTLMALAVARDETFAVAHVEFRSPEHKARAERLRSSTCHAFQMALGCPVELKLSLECPPSVVLEEIKASHAVTQPEPSTSEAANADATVNAQDVDPSAESPPHDEALPRQRRRNPKSRQEMLTGLAARSRRLGDAGSKASFDSRDSIIGNKYCFPMECVSRDAAGSSRRHRLGRRPSLNRVPSGRRDNLDVPGAKRVSVKWRYPKFKGVANLERRKNKKLESRRKRGRAALCWQSPISEREQHVEQLQPQRRQPEQSRKVTFFLRLVPCGRSTQTHGSPNRP